MKRYRMKRDESEADIVAALLRAGFAVWRDLPVDLLVWRPDKGFQLLEVKTPATKAGKRRARHDQKAQDAFLALTGTQVVLTPEAALQALGAL